MLVLASGGRNLAIRSGSGGVRLRVAAPPEKQLSFIITTWLALLPRAVSTCCMSLSRNRPSRATRASVQRAWLPRAGQLAAVARVVDEDLVAFADALVQRHQRAGHVGLGELGIRQLGDVLRGHAHGRGDLAGVGGVEVDAGQVVRGSP